MTLVPVGTPALRDAWRASVTALLRHAAYTPPLALLHRLHTVLKVRHIFCMPQAQLVVAWEINLFAPAGLVTIPRHNRLVYCSRAPSGTDRCETDLYSLETISRFEYYKQNYFTMLVAEGKFVLLEEVCVYNFLLHKLGKCK